MRVRGGAIDWLLTFTMAGVTCVSSGVLQTVSAVAFGVILALTIFLLACVPRKIKPGGDDYHLPTWLDLLLGAAVCGLLVFNELYPLAILTATCTTLDVINR